MTPSALPALAGWTAEEDLLLGGWPGGPRHLVARRAPETIDVGGG
ncbi:MAG TPA: hypothetical protein VMU75_00045 [Acidimicrobiales bacterium]|nr:hypothetical protein [Acidimicrobiales bacterium]